MAKSKKMAKGFSAKSHDLSVAIPHYPAGKHLDKYEVESAAHTIIKHHEIKSDKKLHRAAKRHIAMKQKLHHKALKEK